jgi:antitoxin VapB
LSERAETIPVAETERLRERAARLERRLAIAAEIRAGMPDDVTSDHSWLYDDETGLPK